MKQSYKIGILFSDQAHSGLTHDYFAGIIESLKITVEAKGYQVSFMNSTDEKGDHISYVEQVKKHGYDGVMIACIDFQNAEVKELVNSGLPMVSIDQDLADTMSVMSDNEKGICELTQYIIDQGHKNIAFIMGDDNYITGIRKMGFLDTCEKNGITIDPEYLKQCAYRDLSKTAYYTEELLNMPVPPTCIIYPDDYAVIGGLNVINARGYNIPKDVSIAGYDGHKVMTVLQPRLTTVVQDTYEIGRVAAVKLLARIEDPTTPLETVTIDTKLEKGRTVGKAF